MDLYSSCYYLVQGVLKQGVLYYAHLPVPKLPPDRPGLFPQPFPNPTLSPSGNPTLPCPDSFQDHCPCIPLFPLGMIDWTVLIVNHYPIALVNSFPDLGVPHVVPQDRNLFPA